MSTCHFQSLSFPVDTLHAVASSTKTGLQLYQGNRGIPVKSGNLMSIMKNQGKRKIFKKSRKIMKLLSFAALSDGIK